MTDDEIQILRFPQWVAKRNAGARRRGANLVMWTAKTWIVLASVLIGLAAANAADEQPIDVIEDNSFLIEEA